MNEFNVGDRVVVLIVSIALKGPVPDTGTVIYIINTGPSNSILYYIKLDNSEQIIVRFADDIRSIIDKPDYL